MNIKQQLINLERGFWEAAGKPEGDKYYEEHFDDSGILMLPFDGGMLDKTTVLPIIPKSDSWKQYNFSNIKILQINADSAGLYYEVQASHGEDWFHAYIGSVYTRQEDKTWKMLIHQQTSI